jgi:2-haloacid dehalogenase
MSDSWVTFDCFGTLVSWQRGFPGILRRVAGERAEELASAYHTFEAAVERAPYRSYREVLHEALARACDATGISLTGNDLDALATYWDEQPVFDDVRSALEWLRDEGWKLAALTNCDNDLFNRTQKTLPVPLDMVVTAEEVRAYKPALNHFRRFDELTKGRVRWIHVACSWFHDIAPARGLGIPRIWIDRDHTGDDPGAATARLDSLERLQEVFASLNRIH